VCPFLSLSGDIREIKSRRMRFAWHVACMGRKRSSYKVLVGKRKDTIWKSWRRWNNDIDMS
jgi:hypothetical protein